jgi:hypothetical protein
MLLKEPTEMSRSDAKAVGQVFDTAAIKGTAID